MKEGKARTHTSVIRRPPRSSCSVFVFWLSCMSPPPSLPSPRLLNATVSCFSAASHPSFSDLSRDPAPPRPHAHSPSPPPHPFTSSSLALSPPCHHGPPRGVPSPAPHCRRLNLLVAGGVFTRPYHHVMLLTPLPTPAFLRSPITTIGTSKAFPPPSPMALHYTTSTALGVLPTSGTASIAGPVLTSST